MRLTETVSLPGSHRSQRREPGLGLALGSRTPCLSLARAHAFRKPDGVLGEREQCLEEGVAPAWSPFVGTAQDRVTSDTLTFESLPSFRV